MLKDSGSNLPVGAGLGLAFLVAFAGLASLEADAPLAFFTGSGSALAGVLELLRAGPELSAAPLLFALGILYFYLL